MFHKLAYSLVQGVGCAPISIAKQCTDQPEQLISSLIVVAVVVVIVVLVVLVVAVVAVVGNKNTRNSVRK